MKISIYKGNIFQNAKLDKIGFQYYNTKAISVANNDDSNLMVGNTVSDANKDLPPLYLVQNAFWTEGQWYNMTKGQGSHGDIFSLHYAKPQIELITDPTGVYDKKTKRELPFIYQSAPSAIPCKNAQSTSIISGGKAVDFAAFAIGILTLVININNVSCNNFSSLFAIYQLFVCFFRTITIIT